MDSNVNKKNETHITYTSDMETEYIQVPTMCSRGNTQAHKCWNNQSKDQEKLRNTGTRSQEVEAAPNIVDINENMYIHINNESIKIYKKSSNFTLSR